MSRQTILEKLEANKESWIRLPSVLKNDAGESEFEMLLAKSEMTDAGVRSLFNRETSFGGFEYASRKFIHAHLRAGDLFIDAGAHFGLYSLTAAMKFPGEVKVLAIEPHPDNARRLQLWAEFNDCGQQITLARCAASDHEGKAILHQNSTMGHSLVPHGKTDIKKQLQVPLTTIDRLISSAEELDEGQRVFLKIDTEGHELATLKGSLNLLKSGRVAAIIWEKGHTYSRQDGVKDFKAIMSLLRDLGYDSYRFPHEDMGGPLVPYVPSHEECNIISIDSSIEPLPLYEQPWKAHTILPASMRPSVPPEFIRGYTELLIEEKGTDCGRWSRWNMLGQDPDQRAGLTGLLVPENAKVLDIGAGLMLLRDYIPESCSYTPLDIVARNRNCIVADLNQHQYPKQEFDVVTALFVLEFIHDVEYFFKWAGEKCKKLIFTYHHVTPGSDFNRRRASGFFNDFQIEELKTMLGRKGWDIKSISEVNAVQCCFECVKKD